MNGFFQHTIPIHYDFVAALNSDERIKQYMALGTAQKVKLYCRYDKCPEASTRFSSYNDLAKHMNKHSRDFGFRPPILCDGKHGFLDSCPFTVLGFAKEGERKDHKQNRQCPGCGKLFSRVDNLKTHNTSKDGKESPCKKKNKLPRDMKGRKPRIQRSESICSVRRKASKLPKMTSRINPYSESVSNELDFHMDFDFALPPCSAPEPLFYPEIDAATLDYFTTWSQPQSFDEFNKLRNYVEEPLLYNMANTSSNSDFSDIGSIGVDAVPYFEDSYLNQHQKKLHELQNISYKVGEMDWSKI